MLKLKYWRMLLIALEAYFVFTLIYTIVQRGLPDNPIYWIAAIIEVGLAYLGIKYFRYQRRGRNSFMPLAIFLIAIGVPLYFYYTNIAGLKMLGGVFWWFFLAGTSIELYRSFRRPRNYEVHDPLRITMIKIMYTLMLSSVIIAGFALIILTALGIYPLVQSVESYYDFIVIGILSIFSIVLVIIGLYLPRMSGWFYERMISETVYVEVMYDYFFQSTLFTVPAVLGFFSGMLGGGWYIWLPLFALSIIVLVKNFPTNARLNQCIERRSNSRNSLE